MYSVLIYMFPLILLLFEWGLRITLKVDAGAFLGPTLAATGLSFLVPLTKPKNVDTGGQIGSGFVVVSKADHNFIPIVWIFVLLYLFVWAGCCVISIQHEESVTWIKSPPFFLGLVAYVVSLIFSGIKEIV